MTTNTNSSNETNYQEIQQGTTASEVWFAIFPCFSLSFLTCLLLSLSSFTSLKQRFAVEFLLLALPCILCFTTLVPQLILVNTTLVMSNAILYAFLWYKSKLMDYVNSSKQLAIPNARKPYLTVGRSVISWLTVIAILAVDFAQIFPERFRKTTMYGVSIMDVGVGLFVFENGVVTSEISGRVDSIKKVLKSVAPLILIGGARFVFLTKLNYYYSAFEYGVHWNFFITLAFVRLFTSVLLNLIDVKHSFFLAISMLFLHETVLQLGLGHFALSPYPRHNFFTANREGIISLTGYVGLYFLSLSFGHFIRIKKKETFNLQQTLRLVGCSMSAGWTAIIVYKAFGISRRLANSGYCFWIMFIGITSTTYFYLAEFLLRSLYKRNRQLHPVYAPLIMEAINSNQLAFFLLGNVLTGCVNLTLHPSDFQALSGCIILVLYLFINSGVLTVLYSKKIRIKI